MKKKKDPQKLSSSDTIDLDSFLDYKDKEAEEAAASPNVQQSKVKVTVPEADRVAVVGIFVDDSGSTFPLRSAIIEGLKLSVEAFRGAKGSDFYLDVRGFNGKIYSGMLKNVQDDSFNGIDCNFGSTPLVTYSLKHLENLNKIAEEYRSLGIPTVVAMLVITDGCPNSETVFADDFKAQISKANFAVGMGLASMGSDSAVKVYQDLFANMGIQKVVTPMSTAPEVRHAINQFSQSVAAIATS